ncbi:MULTISPECIES: FecR family protein [Thalassospira]|uniref:Iron dicitrate transport regulator FecR n=2 Tax=Thalassospira TaxID=168934 RepID=A0A367WE78_9PROT|nr:MULTISPECIES: DUF4880 domain-containing protein [Thalassospira]MDG4718705.1 DUF4880 domain-containing protein [Thalassospira sp. FZY0004]RCK39687.1 iron dicitrate transport regulator FecR [Thalassospira profundimaris]
MNRYSDIDGTFDTPAAQAAYWFALLLDGSETEQDRQDFARWIEKDPRNRRAFGEVERVWSGSSSLNLANQAKVGRRAFMAGGLLAGILATGWGAQRYHPMADFRTRTGERRTVSLPGGVKATLASDTTMSLVAGYGTAGVELHHGEVWFDHAPENGDFFVASSGGHSWSRGGKFDIAHFGDESTVTVESRNVAVKLGNQMAQVTADHALTYGPDKLGPVRKVDVTTDLAWRNGQLVFMGEQLGDVARILERWQAGKIVIIGDDVARRKVTMVVDLDRTRGVLPALAGALSLKVDQFTDYLTVIRAA